MSTIFGRKFFLENQYFKFEQFLKQFFKEKINFWILIYNQFFICHNFHFERFEKIRFLIIVNFNISDSIGWNFSNLVGGLENLVKIRWLKFDNFLVKSNLSLENLEKIDSTSIDNFYWLKIVVWSWNWFFELE